MNPLVYEGPGNQATEEPNKEETKAEPMNRMRIDGFEFESAVLDPKTNTIKIHSLLNLLMVALASSTDPKIREVLDKSGIRIDDLKGKQYFPK